MKKSLFASIAKGCGKYRGLRLIPHFFGGIYRSGTSVEKGVSYVEKSYHRNHRFAALDNLGESSLTTKKAQFAFDTYMAAIFLLRRANHQREKDDSLITRFGEESIASLSMKASAISCFVRPSGTNPDPTYQDARELLEDRLVQYCELAKQDRMGITIDAEDSNWSDLELDVARTMWDKDYNNFGIVLQSRLRRTEKDVQAIKQYVDERNDPKFTKNIRIRACIGAYLNEPAIVAYSDDKIIKNNLIQTIKGLFEAGVYVEIATHDNRVVKEVVKYIQEEEITNDRFEFQFLKGVAAGEKIEPWLKSFGYKVRVYTPFEAVKYASIPYTNRRIDENPKLADLFMKNLGYRLGGLFKLNNIGSKRFRYK